MAGSGAKAAIVADEDGGGAYKMFEARDLSTEGAFLAGTLLLEEGEEFDVELSFEDEAAVKVRARVTGVQSGGERPGMSVSFTRLEERARKELEKKLGTNNGC